MPARGNDAASQPFGYERFELNFGKQIPQFKTYNSMMPLWRQLDRNTGDAIHLLALYSAISEARSASPARRSKDGWFLRLKRGTPQDQIFAIGKVTKVGADPASSDTVFAFVNLAVSANAATLNGVGFDLDIKAGQQNISGSAPVTHTTSRILPPSIRNAGANACGAQDGRAPMFCRMGSSSA